MITETTITGFTGFDPKGKPEFERARKAMQYSNSIDDYARIMLEGNNGGYANDWLIGDNKTGEADVGLVWPRLRSRFHHRRFSETAQGVRMDARLVARYENRGLGAV